MSMRLSLEEVVGPWHNLVVNLDALLQLYLVDRAHGLFGWRHAVQLSVHEHAG
jgi:hypothetical protein